MAFIARDPHRSSESDSMLDHRGLPGRAWRRTTWRPVDKSTGNS
jgi:hypothetical protein